MNISLANISAHISNYASLLQETFAETLWPTRCVICDLPGELICHSCKVNLPYLDQLKACPRCGAAYGKEICTECNRFILDWKHLPSFPLNGCASATILTEETRRIVTAYKDRGEQRLSLDIARFMADALPRSWKTDAVFIPIPTKTSAQRERGFDHIQKISKQLSLLTNIPFQNELAIRKAKDQRLLNGRSRLSNMEDSFELAPNASVRLLSAQHIILIDDVMTTGATLFAATKILRKATHAPLYGLTFSRVQ